MSKVITAQMMGDLRYTCESQTPSQKVGNLKSLNNEFKVFDVVPKNYDASAVLDRIREHLDTLAAIESEENHVPLVRAKQSFARAIILQPTTLIQDIKTVCSFPPVLWTTMHSTIPSLIEQIMFRILRKHANIVLHVDSRREKLVNYLAKILEWETNHNSQSKPEVNAEQHFDGVCSMFVFRSSDVEAAVDYLSQSIADPFGENKIREVYVQESALDSFKTKLQRNLRCYCPEVLNDPLLRQRHEETEKILKKLNASTIRPLNTSENDVTPIICYEFDLSYFPPNSPVVVLKVFRTAKEAVSLATKDGVRNASIWTESLALAYELVSSLDCRHFWINCLGVGCKMWTVLSMLLKHSDKRDVFAKMGYSGVQIENPHHFEYFEVKGFLKFIAFPFGVTFAN